MLVKKFKIKFVDKPATDRSIDFCLEDSIYIVKEAIKATQKNDYYLYCKVQATKDSILTSLMQFFYDREYVKKEEFYKYLESVTDFENKDKDNEDSTPINFRTASALFLKNSAFIYISLGINTSRYIQFNIKNPRAITEEEGNDIIDNNQKILGSFDIENDTIYARVTNDRKLIFPFNQSDASVQSAMELFNSIGNTNSQENSKKTFDFIHVTFPYTRLNIDPNQCFHNIQLDSVNVPFAKLTNFSQTLYKLNKDYDNIRHIKKWTQTPPNSQNAYSESLFLKMPFEQSNQKKETIMVTTTINLKSIDIKMKIYRKDRYSFKQLNKLIMTAVDHIERSCGVVFYSRVYKTSSMIVHSSVETKELISIKDLNSRIQSTAGKVLFNIVEYDQESGSMKLIYKRGDDFYNETNIHYHLSLVHSKKPGISKKELSDLIQDAFNLDKRSAKDCMDRWNSEIFHVTKSKRSVIINIRAFHGGFQYDISGPVDNSQTDRLHAILKHLVMNKPKKEVVDEQDSSVNMHNMFFQSIDDLINQDSDDEDVTEEKDDKEKVENQVDVESEEKDQDDPEFAINSEEEQNLSKMKRAFHCPKPTASRQKKGTKQKDSNDQGEKANRYVLKELAKADPDLFGFGKDSKITNPNKTFARKCQASNNRQPSVLTNDEIEYNNKCFPGALSGIEKYGSSDDHAAKNNYTCPQIWCPKTRVALTTKQFEEYGYKCPFSAFQETPIQFYKSDYFKGNQREIGYISPADHPKQLCMLCCFTKKLTDKNNKCKEKDEESANTKYILKSYPLPANRYGSLPINLGKFLGNSGCENTSICDKTDCFLRYGVPVNVQPLFGCLELILGTTNIVKTIVKNLTVIEFMSLAKGDIIRHFMPSDPPFNFAEFKTWFQSQDAYIDKFELTGMKAIFKKTKYLNTSLPIYPEIIRHNKIRLAFERFIEYINDDQIIKNHEVVLPIIETCKKWINPGNVDFVVFEMQSNGEVLAMCTGKGNDAIINQTAFIIKFDNYYEPIHYVSYKMRPFSNGGIYIYDRIHDREINARVAFALNSISQSCPKIKTQVIDILFQVESITIQIIDTSFRVVALCTKDNVMIPLKTPGQVKFDHPSKIMFLDVFLQKAEPITKEFVDVVLKKINEYIGTSKPFYVQEEYSKKQGFIKLNDIELPIPLRAINSSDILEGVWSEVFDNFNIFVQRAIGDQRVEFVKNAQNEQILIHVLKNEMVNLAMYNKDISKALFFLRHPSNPMSTENKIAYFRKQLNKSNGKGKTYINRIVTLRDELVPKFAENKDAPHPSLCTNKSRKTCIGDVCTYIADNNDKNEKGKQIRSLFCRVRLKEDTSNFYIDKSIDYLLNPLTPLTVTNVNLNIDNNINTLIFDHIDVKEMGIMNILHHLVSKHKIYEQVAIPLQKLDEEKKETKQTKQTKLQSWIKEENPVKMPNNIKNASGFMLTSYFSDEEEYNPKWIVWFFRELSKIALSKKAFFELLVNNVIETCENSKESFQTYKAQANRTISTIKELKAYMNSEDYYPSDFDLQILSDMVNINTLVYYKKNPLYPDRMRCFGRFAKEPYIMLQKRVNQEARTKNEFYLYSKQSKVVFTIQDFKTMSPLFYATLDAIHKTHKIVKHSES